MVGIITSEVVEALIVQKKPFIVLEDKYYTLSLKGDILISDMRVVNELTITDIFLRVLTDEKFATEYMAFIDRIAAGRIEKEQSAIIPSVDTKEETIEPQSEVEDILPTPKQQREIYTYLMHDPACGLYKIGKSKDVQFREKTLGGQIPLIKTICSAPIDIESQLHNRYAEHRKRGEWFDLSEDAVNEIVSLLQEAA